jgi:nicotinamidase-related amidase
MTVDVTLRSLFGLDGKPAGFRDSVLVMIDCQDTYRHGVMQLDHVESALTEAAHLLARARAEGVPVVHVMHDAGPGTPYDVTAQIGQISPEVAPAGNESIIVKHYPSSFVQTELDERLRAIGRQDLILAGFMTHMCVNSTARGAFNLGYRPTIVAAATATRELPGPDGLPVPAVAVQAASLAGVADLFALVVESSESIPD